MRLSRRTLLAGAGAPLVLAGCGFALRQAPKFAFRSIYLALPAGSALTAELRRQLEGTGQLLVITDATRKNEAEVVLESAGEQRERVVVSLTATGQVREYQLRMRFNFRVLTPAGRPLLAPVLIARQIDQSYSESEALSKDLEAQMLFQNMQTDIVQQVMRRLATIRL